MSDCILRFYNARQAANLDGKKLTPVDRIIMSVSDPLVHTEFQFSDRKNSVSHSATMRGDFNCSRDLQIKYTHPLRWTSLILPMTDQQEEKAWSKSRELLGKPYDLIGLGSFGSDWDIVKPDPDKLWCSENNAELIKAAYEYGGDFVPHSFHPVGLFFEMYRRLLEGKAS